MRQLLANGAQQFDLALSEAQLDAFERYSRELIAWNERVNLTRIVAPGEIVTKHFLDSLSVSLVLPELRSPFAIIDVGSGAGFPGLPLKIALPDIALTLLEATAKKTAFLEHLVGVLGLTGVTILTARAETVGRRPEKREQYDAAVARAVSALSVLVEYTLPLVKVGGWIILQKGQDPTSELKEAANALQILGGRVSDVRPVPISGLEATRHLVVIEKNKPTPESYPRRPGLPAKKPL
ncbi:MAG TPA: 16S rRNA (guanine(527)-N(7))-methyltransferase RsmG [Anaerolineae bacterium]|jgi:16S rRNA (guanine527-N7)-methyltransferase